MLLLCWFGIRNTPSTQEIPLL